MFWCWKERTKLSSRWQMKYQPQQWYRFSIQHRPRFEDELFTFNFRTIESWRPIRIIQSRWVCCAVLTSTASFPATQLSSNYLDTGIRITPALGGKRSDISVGIDTAAKRNRRGQHRTQGNRRVIAVPRITGNPSSNLSTLRKSAENCYVYEKQFIPSPHTIPRRSNRSACQTDIRRTEYLQWLLHIANR